MKSKKNLLQRFRIAMISSAIFLGVGAAFAFNVENRAAVTYEYLGQDSQGNAILGVNVTNDPNYSCIDSQEICTASGEESDVFQENGQTKLPAGQYSTEPGTFSR